MYETRWNESAAIIASTMFVIGPAAATSTMSRRGLPRARKFKGTAWRIRKKGDAKTTVRWQKSCAWVDVLERIERDRPRRYAFVIAESMGNDPWAASCE